MFINYIISKMDMTKYEDQNSWSHEFLRVMDVEKHISKASLRDEEHRIVRCNIFENGNDRFLPSGYNDWTEQQFEIFVKYLKSFVVTYKSERNGDSVNTGKMKGSIASLQRIFDVKWGYKLPLLNERHKPFGNVGGGLWKVMDKLFRKQQAEGMVRKSHNLLSIDDVIKLYSSPELSETTPRSFQCRLIFGVSIMTSMGPTELSVLQKTQFRKRI